MKQSIPTRVHAVRDGLRARRWACLTALGLAAISTPAASAALVIDSFSTQQNVTVSGGPAGPKTAFGAALAPEVIGGERDIQVNRTSNNTGTVAVDVNDTLGSAVTYSSGVATRGSSIISYDGNDGVQPLNATGLGSVDLTQGGVNTAFSISRVADLSGVSLKIRVYSDATKVSEATVSVPVDPVNFILVPTGVPFASFVGIGSGGAADFSNVGALELVIDGTTAGGADAAVGVDAFTAVPEASTWVPALSAMLALLLSGMGRRGIRINHEESVS